MFRIHDILRRIRILGSVKRVTDPYPAFEVFPGGSQNATKKLNLFHFDADYLPPEVPVCCRYIYISFQR
jgi:hypothetical protein